MRFERLTIKAGEATFSLGFHRRMTVVAGVGPLEREGLINELVGALSSGRSGVSLEVTSDAGTHFAVIRPTGGAHRVVDLDSESDVTSSFASEDGRVNLLERAGLTLRSAKKAMRMTEDDLTTRSQSEEHVLALAHVDQARLWDVATKVKEREVALDEAAGALGSDPEDSTILQEIERHHAELETAETRHERARSVSMLVGVNLTMLAVPLALTWGLAAALPFLFGAIGVTGYSGVFWRRMVQARRDEQDALEAAGAESYLSFQIHRVNGLLSDDHQRRETMRIAEYHRAALAEWHVLAGDVSVDWAIEHRSDIRRAATRLRDTVGVRNPMALTMSHVEGTEADLTHAVQARLTQLRTLGAGGESFPLLLDEPFTNVPNEVKPRLLHRLIEASGRQQVIVLTADDDVADWARVAPPGDVSLVEPDSASRQSAGSGTDRRRRRHIAVA